MASVSLGSGPADGAATPACPTPALAPWLSLQTTALDDLPCVPPPARPVGLGPTACVPTPLRAGTCWTSRASARSLQQQQDDKSPSGSATLRSSSVAPKKPPKPANSCHKEALATTPVQALAARQPSRDQIARPQATVTDEALATTPVQVLVAARELSREPTARQATGVDPTPICHARSESRTPSQRRVPTAWAAPVQSWVPVAMASQPHEVQQTRFQASAPASPVTTMFSQRNLVGIASTLSAPRAVASPMTPSLPGSSSSSLILARCLTPSVPPTGQGLLSTPALRSRSATKVQSARQLSVPSVPFQVGSLRSLAGTPSLPSFIPATPSMATKPTRFDMQQPWEKQSHSWVPPATLMASLQLPQDVSILPPKATPGALPRVVPPCPQPGDSAHPSRQASSTAISSTALVTERTAVEQSEPVAQPVRPASSSSRGAADEAYLSFTSASSSRQHPAKTNTGIVNADAIEEGFTHLGICDGVSGVHHLGIPPDELPWELLRSCRARLQLPSGHPEAEAEDGWITGLIQDAYDNTQAYGATTLLLAVLRGSDLITANIGDCSLIVLRPQSLQPLQLRLVFKTEPGRYDARRPVQVQRLHGFSDENARDVIKRASVSRVPVRHGDIVVLGSDGLFDNLRDEEIKRVLERRCGGTNGSVPHRGQLQQAAGALVDAAISNVGLDSTGARQMDPWQVPGNGGVPPANNADDTTALVAVLVAADASTAAPRDSEEPLESCAGVINF